MDLGLTDRAAVISGGSKGQGLATAEALLAEGCRVAIAARTPETLQAAAAQLEAQAPGRVLAVAADMTDAADVDRVVAAACERFGGVDIAVSNVIGHVIDPASAGPHAGYFTDTPTSEYAVEFKQLLLSAWLLVRAVIPGMKARGWGRIFNIASGSAREPQWEIPHILPNTVRPAVAAMHRSLAVELAPHGITVNNMLTGPIATQRMIDYFTWLAKDTGADVDALLAERYRQLPVRRPGQPEDMGRMIAFLCSQQAAAISGQSIAVVGGRLRHIY